MVVLLALFWSCCLSAWDSRFTFFGSWLRSYSCCGSWALRSVEAKALGGTVFTAGSCRLATRVEL
jgi:hypothetical protein